MKAFTQWNTLESECKNDFFEWLRLELCTNQPNTIEEAYKELLEVENES